MNDFPKKSTFVFLGGIIQGLAMGLFLFPQSIPSGGAGGVAILLNHLFNIPMGPALWMANFSLLLFGITYLGKRFAVWTVFGMTVASLSIDFFETYLIIPERNLLFDLVIGSVILGIGVGLLMRQGVSNGGFGVLAYMLAFKRNIAPGKPLFFFNCTIFFITAAVISWEIIFLALISQWISTRIVDIIYSYQYYEVYTLDWRNKNG
ncbi:MAG TPA: YitT family protein [Cerasibacillus sp.]|uniref:YitT family protein n=1 Tax=Cerasibacillus sp. TaxID=2498711 RepID=UPI002F420FEF